MSSQSADEALFHDGQNYHETFNILVRKYDKLINYWVAQTCNRCPSLDFNEGKQVALISFYHSVRTFIYKPGGVFIVYAAAGVRHSLINEMRRLARNTNSVSLDEKKNNDLSLLETVASDLGMFDPPTYSRLGETIDNYAAGLACLNDRSRLIWSYYLRGASRQEISDSLQLKGRQIEYQLGIIRNLILKEIERFNTARPKRKQRVRKGKNFRKKESPP